MSAAVLKAQSSSLFFVEKKEKLEPQLAAVEDYYRIMSTAIKNQNFTNSNQNQYQKAQRQNSQSNFNQKRTYQNNKNNLPKQNNNQSNGQNQEKNKNKKCSPLADKRKLHEERLQNSANFEQYLRSSLNLKDDIAKHIIGDARVQHWVNRNNSNGLIYQSFSEKDAIKAKRMPIRCDLCKFYGHLSHACSIKELAFKLNNSVLRNGACRCHICGSLGHPAEAGLCPYTICSFCHQSGHANFMCPNKDKISRTLCHRCQRYGHRADSCPDQWRQFDQITSYEQTPSKGFNKRDAYCYQCAQKGHYGYNCPEFHRKYFRRDYHHLDSNPVFFFAATSPFVRNPVDITPTDEEIISQLVNSPIDERIFAQHEDDFLSEFERFQCESKPNRSSNEFPIFTDSHMNTPLKEYIRKWSNWVNDFDWILTLKHFIDSLPTTVLQQFIKQYPTLDNFILNWMWWSYGLNRDLERFTGDPFRANGSMPWLQLDTLASADQKTSFEQSLENNSNKTLYKPACKFFQYNKNKPEMLNSLLMSNQEANGQKRQSRSLMNIPVQISVGQMRKSKSCCSVLNSNKNGMVKENENLMSDTTSEQMSECNKNDETLVECKEHESSTTLIADEMVNFKHLSQFDEPVSLKRKNNMPDNSSSEFKKLKNDDKICTFDDLLRSFNCLSESNKNTEINDKVTFDLGPSECKQSAFSNFISRLSDPVRYSQVIEPLNVQTNLNCSNSVSKSETFLDALFRKSSQSNYVPVEPVKKTNIFDKLFSPHYHQEPLSVATGCGNFNFNSFNLMTNLMPEPQPVQKSDEFNEKLMKESTNLLKLILKIDNSQNSVAKPSEEIQPKQDVTITTATTTVTTVNNNNKNPQQVIAKVEPILKPNVLLPNNQKSNNGLKTVDKHRNRNNNNNSYKLQQNKQVQQKAPLDTLQLKKSHSPNFINKTIAPKNTKSANENNKENVANANEKPKVSRRKNRNRSRKFKKTHESSENQPPKNSVNIIAEKSASAPLTSQENGQKTTSTEKSVTKKY